MPRFCANLTMLWNELDFIDRFAAAANAGFKGVEYLFPYDYDKNQLAEQLDKHRLTQVLFNLPAGSWAGGERGIGCHPRRVNEFQDGVGKAIEYARALGCQQVNCLAGIRPAQLDPIVARETYATGADNVDAAVSRLNQANADVVVTVTPGHEPLYGPGSLRPGQHVSLMGADGPGKAEAEGVDTNELISRILERLDVP